MRGMFAAISGLKTHQVMLDVTSNDIANVNTIGYKSARTTFTDSLTQLQRGASGPGGGTGGSNAAQIGLGTQLGSIDNLMTVGRAAVDGQPARRRHPGPGLLPRRRRAPATPPAAEPGRRRVHPRRQLHHQQRRLPGHPGRLLRPGPHGRRRRHAAAASRPARPTWRSARTARSATSTAPAPASVGRLHLAGDVLELGRPRALRLEPLAAERQLGRADRRHPERAVRLHHRRRDRDVQRGPRPVVHEHDHRPARLPGQLARHLDGRRDAAGPGEPEALVAAALSADDREGPASCGPFLVQLPALVGR